MLLLSMRMSRQTYPSGSSELRDCLAQDWGRFLASALPGLPWLPVPNLGAGVQDLLANLPVTGVILTGGEDWGVFPERDATEALLLTCADRHSLPVLGVCRGAQVINRLRGGRVSEGFGETHAATRQSVTLRACETLPDALPGTMTVNSYHRLGIRAEDLAPGLVPWALAEDGSTEAFCGDRGRILALIWHPEREQTPNPVDIQLFQHLFSGRKS